MLALPYTICFCLRGSQVLMLYRNKAPNAQRWNGLGGRIERDEMPFTSIRREMMEEAEIDLAQAENVYYTGSVSWATGDDPTRPSNGMYTYLARFAPDFPIWPDRRMNEGLLSWKALDWVCRPGNRAVVSNIPRFFPLMLADPCPREYACVYRQSRLRTLQVRDLPPGIVDGSARSALF